MDTLDNAAPLQPPTGSVTVMFTDIVGSTKLRDELVDNYGEREGNRFYRERYLGPHNERINSCLSAHYGYLVKMIGDSFMAVFAYPEDAIRCAVAIQRNLHDEPITTPDEPLQVRIGLHTGIATAFESNGLIDYDGHAVNIAARVESLAPGKRIYCSHETALLVKAGSNSGFQFHNYGQHILKGVSRPIEIFDVLWQEAMSLQPPEEVSEGGPYPWLTPWVGREREMAQLDAALRANRLVTLKGIGGVGKTRLAVETLRAAHSGMSRRFTFVSLERVADSAEGLLGAIRDALGSSEGDIPSVAALCRHLQRNERLLLLDNFESVMNAASDLSELARTAGVRILVTSQKALGVNGEQIVDIEPLPVNGTLEELESYRLFLGLARRRAATWQPNDTMAMREVLAATDGLPFVIELVAALAPKRRLRELAEELKTHLSAARARPGYASSDRHSSIDASLEWSLGHLAQNERNALTRLAIFKDGFAAEAAETVALTSQPSLDTLVDASLLHFDCALGRYSFLPTTRLFALNLLDTDAQSRLEEAHARWFIERLVQVSKGLSTKGGETQREAYRWIDAEFGNVQQAVSWAENEHSELFGEAVLALHLYLQRRSRYSEMLRLNQILLSRVDEEVNPVGWATTQNSLGTAYYDLPTGDRSRNLAKAVECYEAALGAYSAHDMLGDWALTQLNLGMAYKDLSTGDPCENLTKAIACYEAALGIFNERNAPTYWAMAQNNLGIAYARLTTGDRGENLTKAIACYEAAQRYDTESDFPVSWAVLQNNLASAHWDFPGRDRAENLTKAIACLVAASRVPLERDSIVHWVTTQSNLGIAYHDLPIGDRGENLTKAIACHEAVLRVRNERDFPREWARAQSNLGDCYAEFPIGDKGENCTKAIACYEAALRVYTERDFPRLWARTQRELGNTYLDLPLGDRGDNMTKAVLFFQAALRVQHEREFPIEWALTQNNLGSAYRELPIGDRAKNISKAISFYEAALRVRTEREFPDLWAWTQNNLGIAYWKLPSSDRSKNFDTAIACFDAALRVYTEHDFPADWAMTQRNLARVYEELVSGGHPHRDHAILCFESAARGYTATGHQNEADDARTSAANLKAATDPQTPTSSD